MTAVLVQSLNTNGTGWAYPNWPTIPVAGNLLICAVTKGGGTVTLADTTGWTRLQIAAEVQEPMAVYYKIADGTETGVSAYCLGGGIQLYEFSGVTTSLGVDDNQASPASTMVVTNPTTSNGQLFIRFRSSYWNYGAGSWSGTPDGSLNGANLYSAYWLAAAGSATTTWTGSNNYGNFSGLAFGPQPPAKRGHRVNNKWSSSPITVKRRAGSAWVVLG